MNATAVALVLAWAAPAAAEPPPNDAPTAEVRRTRPGDESGRLDRVDPGDSLARKLARGALWLPRTAVDVVLFPVRSGIWMFERYQLDDRFHRIFFNDARTVGLYPTATLESGFGVTLGARFVDRDVLGEREHFYLLAGYGGQFREVARTQLRSGNRFGDHVALELDAAYEQRPQDAFYGIGNADETSAMDVVVDPRAMPLAVETRYHQRLARVAALADVRAVSSLHVVGAGALVDHIYGSGVTGTPIESVYDPAGLIGWMGERHAYAELELRWDSRRHGSEWEPVSVFGTGALASVYAGRTVRFDADRDYWRYGADLQYFLHLDEGPRVVVARAHGEAVSGTLDEVPFAELPTLGGSSILRGYPLDRFRDRVAAVGSLEYRWDLGRPLDAGFFVDAGRVYSSVRDITLDHMRVGYGALLELHSDRGFVVETSVATSIDGGVFFNLSLSPIFDVDPRVRRR
jgi:surface antigen Omp85-like protein